jgi:hypothetical protein
MQHKYEFIKKYLKGHRLKTYDGGEFPIMDITFENRITVFVDCPELVLADDFNFFSWVFYMEDLLSTYFNISTKQVVFIQRIIL